MKVRTHRFNEVTLPLGILAKPGHYLRIWLINALACGPLLSQV